MKIRPGMFFKSLPSGVLRSGAFAGVWIFLAEGRMMDLPVAAVIVILATAASYFVMPPGMLAKFRPAGLLRFILFFIVQSLRGGVDVAWRALHPALPIDPVLETEPLHLQGEGLRILYAWTVSLLPGTASVQLTKDSLTVHILARTPTTDRDLQQLEKIIQGLYKT